MENFKISIPEWMKTKTPVQAAICEYLNMELENGNGNMTIQELAKILDQANKDMTYDIIHTAIRNQLLGVTQQ